MRAALFFANYSCLQNRGTGITCAGVIQTSKSSWSRRQFPERISRFPARNVRTGTDLRKAIAAVLMVLVLPSCAPVAFTSSLYPTSSDGSRPVIEVRSGRLISKDIDGDGDLDLIWIGANEQRSAVVLVNDGAGDFTEAKDNAPYAAALEALLSSDDPG